MKIALATSGSLGDVQPMIALSLALKRRGHETLLCAPPENAARAHQFGIPFRAVGRNVLEFSKTVPDPPLHPLRATIALTRFLQDELATQVHELPESIRGFDLLLSASLMIGAPTAAEYARVPYRFVAYCPQLIPSAEYPPLMFRRHTFSRFVNRVSWSFNEMTWNAAILPRLNRERRKLNLAPRTNFTFHWLGPHVILASDAPLGGIPADALLPCTQTGYLHLDNQDALPSGLEDFLDGPPAVYVGFGSMMSEDPAGLSRLILNAARAAGMRLVLSRGWAQFAADEPDCFIATDVSHAQLFRRVTAVIHHGGSGTTSTAARAAAPQLIVPHISDQFYWAHRIQTLGLGPPPIWRARLTQENLTAAIRVCVSDPAVRERAGQIAAAMEGAEPVESAVQAVENTLRTYNV